MMEKALPPSCLSETVVAVILAAGESRRMGRSKPLLKIGEKNFVEHICLQVWAAGIQDIMVVLGHNAAEISRACPESLHVVTNPYYTLGQFSSLQCAIRAMPDGARAALVCLADQPHISAHIISRLLACREAGTIVRPEYKGHCGHPTLYDQALFPHILGFAPIQNAHEFTQRHAQACRAVAVDDESILWDADTQQDFDHLSAYMTS
jgi:molybdenum cofactor cytidylyltransferase